MTEPAPKTRRTAAEKAQDALTRAEETLAQKAGIVSRLESDLATARKRLQTAQEDRNYAFAHPALRKTPVDVAAEETRAAVEADEQ